MAVPVVSDPVPAVVGTATSGRLGDGESFAQGGVDKVEKVGLGEDGVEVHQLCRVND
jgi:hypothetical protein